MTEKGGKTAFNLPYKLLEVARTLQSTTVLVLLLPKLFALLLLLTAFAHALFGLYLLLIKMRVMDFFFCLTLSRVF